MTREQILLIITSIATVASAIYAHLSYVKAYKVEQSDKENTSKVGSLIEQVSYINTYLDSKEVNIGGQINGSAYGNMVSQGGTINFGHSQVENKFSDWKKKQ